MDAYLSLIQNLSKEFKSFELSKSPRKDNAAADALATLGSSTDFYIRRLISIESIFSLSITLTKGVCSATLAQPEHNDEDMNEDDEETNEDWRQEIRLYITDDTTPTDRWAPRCLKSCSAHYSLIDDDLFRWTTSDALLICLHGDEVRCVIAKTHDGAGGNHSGGRALAFKIEEKIYWPTMISDCEKYAMKCKKY